MGSGTAVAREAADLVLGDDSFLTLTYGLAEGRRLVDNVQKGLVFLVSTHVALLGYIFLATLGGIGQPLLPIQILWMELFIDVAASVAFEREPAEPDVMRRPPRVPGKPLLSIGLFGRIAVACRALTGIRRPPHISFLAVNGVLVVSDLGRVAVGAHLRAGHSRGGTSGSGDAKRKRAEPKRAQTHQRFAEPELNTETPTICHFASP